MAEANETKEVVDTPIDKGSPDVSTEAMADIISATNENEDEIVKELTKTDDEKKDEKEIKVDKEQSGDTKVSTEKNQNQDGQTQVNEGDKVKALEKQLQFYQTLFGDQSNVQRTQQETQQPTQQNTQQQVQQQAKSILDVVDFTDEEYLGLLSGEREKALPVVKKFIATAIALTAHHMQAQQAQQEQVTRYIGGVQQAFYAEDKYKDLENFRPLVKFAGDQIQQEDRANGITRMPHELIDDIGKRARELKNQMLGNNGTTIAPKKVIKQGEVPDIKTAPTPKEKQTEQEKQMFDLLET